MSWLGTCDDGAYGEGTFSCGGRLRVMVIMDIKSLQWEGVFFYVCVGVCELERVIFFFGIFLLVFFFFVMASPKIPLPLAKQICPFPPNCLVRKQLKKYWSLIFLLFFFALLVLLSNIFSCILIFLKKVMSISTRWEKLINYFEISM